MPEEKEHRVISKDEYEHYNFIGEPFSGYVEGVGYISTEIVVTAHVMNNSQTWFMFNFNRIGYSFELASDVSSEEENSGVNINKEEKSQPDRNDFWRVPTFDKGKYEDIDDNKWGIIKNPITFINNALSEVFNPIINTFLNGPAYSLQVLAHEGAGAWWDNEVGAAKGMWEGVSSAVSETYDYTTQTPAKQQLIDTWQEFRNPEYWEKGTAFGATLFAGGALTRVGSVGTSGRMLGSVPKSTVPYPCTTKDGFLFKGFTVKSPINVPVQRFGYIDPSAPNYWGLKIGSNLHINRTFAAIWPEWNTLTIYTTGVIPKGSLMKFGVIGPQKPFWKYPGGSLQFIIQSKYVINKTTKTLLR